MNHGNDPRTLPAYRDGQEDGELDWENGTYWLPEHGKDNPAYKAGYLSVAADHANDRDEDDDTPRRWEREDFHADI